MKIHNRQSNKQVFFFYKYVNIFIQIEAKPVKNVSPFLLFSGHSELKTGPSVSPHSSSMETFREEERLRLSDRNSILMMQTNVYIIDPVVTGVPNTNYFVQFYLSSGRFW